jgi:hypothetical protein
MRILNKLSKFINKELTFLRKMEKVLFDEVFKNPTRLDDGIF